MEPGAVGATRDSMRREIVSLDEQLYAAVANARTPRLDGVMRRVSRSADRSVLWMGVAAVLAAVGGPSGRRAAVRGLAAIAVASATVNLGVKPLVRRRRPARATADPGDRRHVAMPGSTSFPSGHSASAFAFAEGVGSAIPGLAPPVRLAAAVVAYSRVHTGVHYPGDVAVGALIGMSAGEALTLASAVRSRSRPAR